MPHPETTLEAVRAANGKPIPYHGEGFALSGGPVRMSVSQARPRPKLVAALVSAPVRAPAPEPAPEPRQMSDAEFFNSMAQSIVATHQRSNNHGR